MSADLDDLCQQLARDCGGSRVLLVSADGEMLAHAAANAAPEGASADPSGAAMLLHLDEATSETVAQLVSDVIEAHRTDPSTAGAKVLVVSLPGSAVTELYGCATAVDDRAALVVIFDGSRVTLDRVRLRVRRARAQLSKSMPAGSDAEKPSH